MSKNLSELLADARGGTIRVGSADVTAIWETQLDRPCTLKILFERAAEVPQALRMKATAGSLLANGISMKEAIFWSDTAPKQFEVAYQPPRSGGRLQLWNEWRDERGIEHAWIGNAGMIVEPAEDGVLLRCSNGLGPVSFDDFIVQIRITSNVLAFPGRPKS